MSVEVVGESPHVLEVYKAESLSQDAQNILIDALRNYPQRVADAFRHLYSQRTPLIDADFPDTFSRMAATLLSTLCTMRPSSNQDSNIWRPLIESDILEVYIDIVSGDSFFFEPQVRTASPR